MMSYDYLYSLALVVLVALALIAYLVRVLLRGRAQYDRVDRQRGSVLLGKSVMEFGYWALQPMVRSLASAGVSANMLSWASLALGGAAGASLAYGRFGLAALLATFSALLDTLDGGVARLTGKASDAGEVLDACVDRYAEFFFLAGLVLYYRATPALQLLALSALLGSFMVSYSTAKAEALQITPPKGMMRRPERAVYLIVGAALAPFSLPWLEQFLRLPAGSRVPMVTALVVVGVLSNLSAIGRFYAIAVAIRRREAEEAGVAKEPESTCRKSVA